MIIDYKQCSGLKALISNKHKNKHLKKGLNTSL